MRPAGNRKIPRLPALKSFLSLPSSRLGTHLGGKLLLSNINRFKNPQRGAEASALNSLGMTEVGTLGIVEGRCIGGFYRYCPSGSLGTSIKTISCRKSARKPDEPHFSMPAHRRRSNLSGAAEADGRLAGLHQYRHPTLPPGEFHHVFHGLGIFQDIPISHGITFVDFGLTGLHGKGSG